MVANDSGRACATTGTRVSAALRSCLAQSASVLLLLDGGFSAPPSLPDAAGAPCPAINTGESVVGDAHYRRVRGEALASFIEIPAPAS